MQPQRLELRWFVLHPPASATPRPVTAIAHDKHAYHRHICRGHFVGVHSSSFKDFMLKAELMRAVVDFGFEHPSAGES